MEIPEGTTALRLFFVGIISILSTPAIGAFGPDRYNVWVMTAPYVSLPAVMVVAAWAGHLLVFRALREGGRVETVR